MVVGGASAPISSENGFEPYEFTFQNDITPITMVPVKGGELTLPDGLSPAMISDFWIGKYEITWEQYEAFVYGDMVKTEYDQSFLDNFGIDAISGATSPYTDMSFGMGKDNFPATNMTQYGALMFCKWLSAITGDFYRLPTEAEWEFACLAGEKDLVYESFADIARYKKNSGFEYEEVGSYLADELGLYDMKGNVEEWTMDQYIEDFYPGISGQSDPWNRPVELYPRTIRGGSWKDEEEDCQCTSRKASQPRWKKRDPQIPKSKWWYTNAAFVGFRIVRPRAAKSKEEMARFWLEPIEDYN